MASARTGLPQSWSRYAYVLNNPLRLVDPTGLGDEDVTFTITNPCEYGTTGCNPVQLATVTFTVPPADPLPLETTSMTIAEHLVLHTGQVASDTAIGAGKYLYNAIYGAANLVNGPIDYGLSFVTDFQFGQAELYQPSTPGEQSAMFGMMIVTAGAGGGAGATNSAVTTSRSTTLYRAVLQNELDDIAVAGGYRLAQGQAEVKGFFSTAEAAAGFAHKMFRRDPSEGPYTITSTTVPNGFLQGNQWQPIAGEGNAIFLRTMPPGPVRVFNFSPNPHFRF